MAIRIRPDSWCFNNRISGIRPEKKLSEKMERKLTEISKFSDRINKIIKLKKFFCIVYFFLSRKKNELSGRIGVKSGIRYPADIRRKSGYPVFGPPREEHYPAAGYPAAGYSVNRISGRTLMIRIRNTVV